MKSEIDIVHIHNVGWARVANAVPVAHCERLVSVLENELGVPIHAPDTWDQCGRGSRDLIPIWGHQAQWDIRQHPNLHRIWATLWETERLWVSLDSCRFTPPWHLGHDEPLAIHWDHDPWDGSRRMFQDALNDIEVKAPPQAV